MTAQPNRSSLITVILLPLLLCLNAHAEGSPGAADDGQTVSSKQLPPIVELSFGRSQLFAELTGSKLNDVGPGGLVPTSSVLFLGEWLMAPKWGLLAAFNLPLTTQRTVQADGTVFEERVAPSYVAGIRYSLLSFDLRPRAILDIQGTLLVGRTFNSDEGDFFFPLSGLRLHLARPNGPGMYAGVTWAFQKETLALLYGISRRF